MEKSPTRKASLSGRLFVTNLHAGKLRLAGGKWNGEGRVEIFHNGSFIRLSVCRHSDKPSLSFEENAIFFPGTINWFLWAALSPSMSSPFKSSLPEFAHLCALFKWRLLIRIMSKPLENCCVQPSVGPPFFKGSLNPPNKRGGGIVITYPCPQQITVKI